MWASSVRRWGSQSKVFVLEYSRSRQCILSAGRTQLYLHRRRPPVGVVRLSSRRASLSISLEPSSRAQSGRLSSFQTPDPLMDKWGKAFVLPLTWDNKIYSNFQRRNSGLTGHQPRLLCAWIWWFKKSYDKHPSKNINKVWWLLGKLSGSQKSSLLFWEFTEKLLDK